jgi:hypothetical protein
VPAFPYVSTRSYSRNRVAPFADRVRLCALSRNSVRATGSNRADALGARRARALLGLPGMTALHDFIEGLSGTQAEGWAGLVAYRITEAGGDIGAAESALGLSLGALSLLAAGPDEPMSRLVMGALIKGLRDAADETRRAGRK